jgi:hypothetical protein
MATGPLHTTAAKPEPRQEPDQQIPPKHRQILRRANLNCTINANVTIMREGLTPRSKR